MAAEQGRIFNPAAGAPGYQDFRQTMFGSLAVDQVAPRYYELARAGLVFTAVHAATGVTAATSFPTTAPNYVLNNVNTNGGLLVPLRVSFILISGTAAVGASILVGTTPSALATQLSADGTAVVHKSTRDAGQTPTAYLSIGSNTVVAPAYDVYGFQNPAVTVGGGITAELNGTHIVKPTFALAVDIVSGAGTSNKWGLCVTYAMIPNTTAMP
jgi:hypothetical protein